jgi:transcriptional regulator with GAF, ATPase, and Fis domain
MLREPAPETTLQTIAELALDTIDGCDFVGISIRYGGGTVQTPAATDPLATKADNLQYDLDQGPCLDAIWAEDQCLIEDMSTETRWPSWAPQAAAIGIASVLSVRLATGEDVIGALNLYSRTAHAYSQDASIMAHIYASHASSALSVTNNVAGLQSALQTRHTIGIAQGLMMHRYGLTDEASFQVLRRLSSHQNRKLRDVAADVLNEFRSTGDLA